MRIYAAADIHGKQHHIDAIIDNVDRLAPDVVVLAGDIYGICDALFLNPKGLLHLKNISPKVLAVKGNSEWWRMGFSSLPSIMSFSGIPLINNAKRQVNGLTFVGIGGAIPLPFRTRVAWLENNIAKKVQPLLDSCSVLICHPPPYGVLDKVMGRFHAGSRLIRHIVDKTQPKLVICGHIHEDAGFERLNNTWIVNCSMTKKCQGSLIDITDNEHLEVQMIS